MKPSLAVALLASLAGVQAKPDENWFKEAWEDVKEWTGCLGLQAVLKLVVGLGQEVTEHILSDLCKLGNLEDDDVCEGLVAQQGPAAFAVLDALEIGSHTAQMFCSSVTGFCEYPDIRPHNLTIPPPKNPSSSSKRPAPSGQKPLRVAHVSDLHIDHDYEVGSNYFCSKPICCHSWDPEVDGPGNTSFPAGPYGNPQCDSPLLLEESMIDAVAAQKPDFTLYTGDIPAHNIWSIDKPSVLHNFDSTFSHLSKLVLVYSALGNHDTAPFNNFPGPDSPFLPDIDDNDLNPKWAYSALGPHWSSLLSSPSTETETNTKTQNAFNASYHAGSYAVTHPSNPTLRIITYNSIHYYIFNLYAYTSPTMTLDPDDQLQWLTNELQAAESASQRVWLVTHVPSGSSDTIRDYSHALDALINRYSDTIAALFFGHTHTDLFQLSYSNYTHQTHSTASAIGYVTGSLTPSAGAPTYRIYDIDPVTFAVLDYTVYTADLPPPNSTTNSKPKWHKYYSAKQAYGGLVTPPINNDPAAELTPAFWHNVTEAMEADDTVFQDWWARTTRGYNVTECTGSCKEREICGLRAGDAQYNCLGSGDGISVTKRDDKNDDKQDAPGHTPHGHVHGHGHGHGHSQKLSEKIKNSKRESEDTPTRPVCEDGGLARVLGDTAKRLGGVDGLRDLIRERMDYYVKN